MAERWDQESAVLVDTGYPGGSEQLMAGLRSHGLEARDLTCVVLTHQDIDHIGNVEAIERAGGASFGAHVLERPYIEGEKRLLRFTDDAIASIDRMPDQVPASFKEGLKALMLHPPRVRIDRLLQPGELLPWCGGIEVIGTFGHTPGHVSLYHRPSRTFVAGDALVVQDGELHGPDEGTTLDLDQAWSSLEALPSYSIDRVVCHHGGAYSRQPSERIAELLEQRRILRGRNTNIPQAEA